MIESSLLSKNEPLTLNIDKVMGVEVLERGLKIQKLAKIGLLDSGFIFVWVHERGNPFKHFPQNYESVRARKKVHYKSIHKMLKSAQPI